MFNMFSNNKGITLVESMIAVFLTAIAIMSLMPMQDTAIRAASRSDYLGRAEGILQAELELQENLIMNSTGAVTIGTVKNQTVNASGFTSGISGDAAFTVVTTVSTGTANSWIVNVQVTWKGNATGIKSSVIVAQIS
jgi:Tfp pilus assembly protein PilV